MKLIFKIWRQSSPKVKGHFETYEQDGLASHMSLFEALDLLNQQLAKTGKDPIEYDHDCREGICGQCGLWINGEAHGPGNHTTSCQLHLRSFSDGDTLTIEPFRARAFPVKKDLKVDRSALDRIIAAGGFISTSTGQAPEANAILISHDDAEAALDAAACIGCGACVAACKNASAALFTGAKISHLAQLPQGRVEASRRADSMVAQMDAEGFGSCTMTKACEAVCPQSISVTQIVRMNQEFLKR